MGILGFFEPQTEERLHRHLSEILTEYFKIRAMLERQRILIEHLKHIHSRIETINAGIRHANSVGSKVERLQLLQSLVDSEEKMLRTQKMLARDLEITSERVIHAEKKTRFAARGL